MESYREFLDRINSFEKSETFFGNDYFQGNPAIAAKVGTDNKYKVFYGDTTVFDLEQETKQIIAGYVNRLYEVAPECFAERLDDSTFHMTLHDLSNSPVLSDISDEVFSNEIRLVEKVKGKIGQQTIRMKSKYVFNMAGTSLVLGLYPVDEEAYNKIMNMYTMLDEVKKLSYPLTMHITLAYYNRNGFPAETARRLENVIRELNGQEMEITLDTRRLYYQKFVSMNHYINIIKLGLE